MSNFILTDRKTDYLLPPSVDGWLTQDHLARFVVEVIDGLDLTKLTRQYAGRGSKARHPATLLAILVYGYCTGVLSSRKLEMSTYNSVAFRYIAAGSHPNHDTLATFRKRFIDELEGLFVQVLAMAAEMKLLKLGTVCLDGTKIHANASRHSARSHGHIVKIEAQLKQEVQELLALAELADTANRCATGYDLRWLLRAIARLGIGALFLRLLLAALEQPRAIAASHCTQERSWTTRVGNWITSGIVKKPIFGHVAWGV